MRPKNDPKNGHLRGPLDVTKRPNLDISWIGGLHINLIKPFSSEPGFLANFDSPTADARYGKYVLANFVAAVASFHLIPQTTMYEAKRLKNVEIGAILS